MLPVMYSTKWFPRMFNELFDDAVCNTNNVRPSVNVAEDEKGYSLEIATPGLKKEDLTVSINDEGNLNIKVEHKEEKKEEDKSKHYLRKEFSYQQFEKTFILPDDVEKAKISAKVDNGVLFVELPKQEDRTPKVARQIEVA